MFSISGLLAFMGGSVVIIAVLVASALAAAGLTIVATRLIKKHKKSATKNAVKAKNKKVEKVKTQTKQENEVSTKVNNLPKKPVTVANSKLRPEEDVSAEDLKADSKYNFVYDIVFDTGNESENINMGWKTNNKASVIKSLESRENSYVNAYVNPQIKTISFQAKYLDENGKVEMIDKKYDLYEDKSASTQDFQRDVEKVLSYFKGKEYEEAKVDDEVVVENKFNTSFINDDSEEIEMK